MRNTKKLLELSNKFLSWIYVALPNRLILIKMVSFDEVQIKDLKFARNWSGNFCNN